MLTHEFIIASREETLCEFGYEITREKKVIIVPDQMIMNNPKFLKGFKTHWNYIGDIHEGLNYHGITIILDKQLLQFVEVLNCYDQYPYVRDLIDLCNNAVYRNECIIHFGI